ncbi:MAG: hypothetical protein M3P08_11245 [Thermoproteota archaeon]|nr:hypothetical protein [Thermoproteota archaeon]
MQSSKAITLGDLYKMIVELSAENQATQKSLAAVRGDITDLYLFYKNHKCYIVE